MHISQYDENPLNEVRIWQAPNVENSLPTKLVAEIALDGQLAALELDELGLGIVRNVVDAFEVVNAGRALGVFEGAQGAVEPSRPQHPLREGSVAQ